MEKLQTKSRQADKCIKEYYLTLHHLFLEVSQGNFEGNSLDVISTDGNPGANQYKILSSHSNSCIRFAYRPASSCNTNVHDLFLSTKAINRPLEKKDDFRRRKRLAVAASMNDVNQQAYQYLIKNK